MRNDHYDYACVNRYLTIAVKTFVKKASCYPESLTAYDLASFTATFTADEKVHIVMLAAEARRQAAMLYGLAAISRHLAGRG